MWAVGCLGCWPLNVGVGGGMRALVCCAASAIQPHQVIAPTVTLSQGGPGSEKRPEVDLGLPPNHALVSVIMQVPNMDRSLANATESLAQNIGKQHSHRDFSVTRMLEGSVGVLSPAALP